MKKRSLGDIIVDGRDYKTLKEMDKAANREVSIIFMLCMIALAIIFGACMLIQWTWEVAGETGDWPGMTDASTIMIAILTFMFGTTLSYASVSGCVKSKLNKMCNEAFGYKPNEIEEEEEDQGEEEGEPETPKTDALSEKVEE